MFESVIGIDFGTSYSCASVYDRNSFHILENLGEKKTLNYVAFKQNGREIGEAIKSKIRMNYNKVLFDSKIFLGKPFDEYIRKQSRFPFEFVSDEQNRLNFKLNETTYAPEEIAAIFLKKMKEIAQNHLKKEVKDAVITVPSSFNYSQRQALKDSAKIAGLNCIRLLNDTTAAAIAYSHDKNIDNKNNILIFDLGAYYLNLALVSIEYGCINVKKSKSFPELGGTMLDANIAIYLIDKFQLKDLNSKAIQTLLVNCEKAKKNLSNGRESHIEIECLSNEENYDTSYLFQRDEFENINRNLFCWIMTIVHQFLNEACVKKHEVEEILLFGGCSRIPKLQEMLRECFVNKPLNMSMNASESVALGAGIQAAFLSGCALKNKNGFKYFEPCNFNYTLKIFSNPFQTCSNNPIPYFEIPIGALEFLPINKSVVLNGKVNKMQYLFELYQNNLKIKNDAFSIDNVDKFSVSLHIDLDGIIRLKTYSSHGRQSIQKYANNFFNLNETKINSIIQSNVDYETHQNELKNIIEKKNQYEQKFINFKAKLNGLDNTKSISATVDTYLDQIRSNELCNFCFFDTELNNLENKLIQMSKLRNECLNLKRSFQEIIQHYPNFSSEKYQKINKKLDDLANSNDEIDKIEKEVEITKSQIKSTRKQAIYEEKCKSLFTELNKTFDNKIPDENNNVINEHESLKNELSRISNIFKTDICDNYELLYEELKTIKHRITKMKQENCNERVRANSLETKEEKGFINSVKKIFR